MKNGEQPQTLQKSLEQQQTKQIKCAQNNEAELLCTNDECSHLAFLCSQKACNCQSKHEECMKLTKKSFITALQKKRISFKSVQEKIKEEIQKAIDNLSELQTVLLAQCQQKYDNLTGLTSDEKDFMNAISHGQVGNITGKFIWNIQLNLKKPQQAKHTLSKLQQDMDDFWNQLSNDLTQLQTNVKSRLEKFGKEMIIFQNSKVIKSKGEQRIIEKFFESQGQQIKSASMIYRGSERNFSASKFHYCCDGADQTITICETSYGKKIGGYMPLAWNQTGQHYTDSSLKAFIFSLTNNHKFVPQPDSQNHQFCHGNYGPTYGGRNDFVLRDKCDQYANSNGSVNGTYKNSNYTRGSQQSHELFSGSKNGDEFRVKEYEVWKLEFA